MRLARLRRFAGGACTAFRVECWPPVAQTTDKIAIGPILLITPEVVIVGLLVRNQFKMVQPVERAWNLMQWHARLARDGRVVDRRDVRVFPVSVSAYD
ncbi:hypothetical protein D3C85_1611370 [compost metagenome]